MRSLVTVLVGAALMWGAHEAVAAPVMDSRMPRNWRTWVAMGRCEQPGRGAWGVWWSHPGPRFQGGLGFYSGTWDYYKPRGYPADAGQASWRQQMRVANIIRARVGMSAWSCWARIR